MWVAKFNIWHKNCLLRPRCIKYQVTDLVYDQIGVGYDTTRKVDRRILSRLSHYLRIKESERYIDVACGTGNYTIALASMGARITGVDMSREVLGAAQAKSPHSELLDWRLTDGERIPFATGMFSGAVCTLAMHHFSDMNRTFQEVSRILDTNHCRVY